MVKMGVTSIASAGEGTITLGAASSGFLHINSQITASDIVDIRVYNAAGAFEVCRNCTYTYSATPSSCTITRGTLEAGSNGASRVAFDTGGSGVTVELVATAALGNRTEMALQAITPGGRLTTESGVPVSTSDRTAQSTLYYTPYVHNIINLWDGSEWKPISFTEHTVTGAALTGLTSGKPYDVFAYLSSGALATELLVWTDDTTRATAVTLQDGRYCKSGDKTRLLLGTIYTTGTTTTEDSLQKRYVGNVYNQCARRVYKADTTAHSYGTGANRAWNNDATLTAINFVLPALQTVTVYVNMRATNTYFGAASGGTQVGSYCGGLVTGSQYDYLVATITSPVLPGFKSINALEYGLSGGAQQQCEVESLIWI